MTGLLDFAGNNWPEIATALVAGVALFYSWKTNRENRGYKAASWRLTAYTREGEGALSYELKNIGGTRARNVEATLNWDPLFVFTSAKQPEFPLVEPKDKVQIHTSLNLIANTSYANPLFQAEAARSCVVSWTDTSNKRRTEVAISPANANEASNCPPSRPTPQPSEG